MNLHCKLDPLLIYNIKKKKNQMHNLALISDNMIKKIQIIIFGHSAYSNAPLDFAYQFIYLLKKKKMYIP